MTRGYLIQEINENQRVYHSRERLLPMGLGMIGMLKGQETRTDLDLGVTINELPSVLVFVLGISGVVQAEVRAHHVVLVKSPVFDWDEIDDHMLRLLQGAKFVDEVCSAAWVDSNMLQFKQDEVGGSPADQNTTKKEPQNGEG